MESAIVKFSGVLQSKKLNFQTNNKIVIDSWSFTLNNKNNTFTESLDNVVSSYANSIHRLKNYFDYVPFDNINVWFKEVIKDNEKHFKEGHNFNIFHLLREKFGFCIQETMHSRLIKFLLDTRETHGQGDLFLMEFLKMLGIKTPEDGIWNVTAEVGRIDVLIERKYPESVIVIENKSNWACDQMNQLYRYWYHAIYRKTKQSNEVFYNTNNDKYQMLYLVPNTDKVIEKHSISKPKDDPEQIYHDLPDEVPMQIAVFTFDNHIQGWLNNCITALPESNHRIREYIVQYQTLCNNL